MQYSYSDPWPGRLQRAQAAWKAWHLGLLLLHLGIVVPLGYFLNLWIDEAYSLNTVQAGPWAAVTRALLIEEQPPLYFVLLGLWQQVSDSIFWARLLSIGFSALTIWVTPALSRRYAPGLHPAWLTAAVALHPFLIWAALEIRPYALGIWLSALLLLCFFDGFWAADKGWARLGYGVVAVAAIYTNYLLLLGLVANALVVLVLCPRQLWRHGLVLLGVGLACLPLLLPALQQFSASQETLAHLPVSLLGSAKHTLGRALIHTVSTCPGPWAGWQRLLCYRLVAIAVLPWLGALGVLVLRQRRRVQHPQWGLWLSTAVTALLLVLLLYATNRALRASGYTFIVFVPTLVSLFAAIAALRPHLRQRLLQLWLAIALPFALATLAITYSPLAKIGDWQRLAQYLEAHESPNQPILVFYAEAALPLGRYYGGVNQLVPLPQPVGLEAYDFQAGVLTSEAQVQAALERLPKPMAEAWLVSVPNEHLDDPSLGHCPVLGLDFNCHILETYVQTHYGVEARQDFYHATVRRLRALPPPSPAPAGGG